MSMLAVDGHMQTLVWMLVKVSALQAAGAVVYAVLGRHRSAATRHLIWTITVVGFRAGTGVPAARNLATE